MTEENKTPTPEITQADIARLKEVKARLEDGEQRRVMCEDFKKSVESLLRIFKNIPIELLVDITQKEEVKNMQKDLHELQVNWVEAYKTIKLRVDGASEQYTAMLKILDSAHRKVVEMDKFTASKEFGQMLDHMNNFVRVAVEFEQIEKRGTLAKIMAVLGRRAS